MHRRIIYASILLSCSAHFAYGWKKRLDGTTFIENVRLVFPEYLSRNGESVSEKQNRTV